MLTFSLFKVSKTLSVKVSQPLPWCDAGLLRSTVKELFNSKTPCAAHYFKFPVLGRLISRSVFSSLNMFSKEGGGCTPSLTEKLRPWACPLP